jgi:hypothetical protein
MEKSKIVRLSAEVLSMLTSSKEFESDSMNRTMIMLLEKYNPEAVSIDKSETGYVLRIDYAVIPIPTLSVANKSIRVSNDVYNRLGAYRSHPDETLNTTVFKIISYHNEKIDPIHQMHRDFAHAVGHFGIYMRYIKNRDEFDEFRKLYCSIFRCNFNERDFFFERLSELKAYVDKIELRLGSIIIRQIREDQRILREYTTVHNK